MPSNVVKTKADEKKWQKAKELAKEQGHKDDYAYIMGIYKKMKPDYFKGKESGLDFGPRRLGAVGRPGMGVDPRDKQEVRRMLSEINKTADKLANQIEALEELTHYFPGAWQSPLHELKYSTGAFLVGMQTEKMSRILGKLKDWK